jgi:hypothetical protein
MLGKLQNLFDNPIYRIYYSKFKLKEQFTVGLFLSIFLTAILLFFTYFYVDVQISIISLGLLIFILLSSFYMAWCFGSGSSTTREPLIDGIKYQVADQVVLSGITPWCWLCGHLLICLKKWLMCSLAVIPLFSLCMLLENITITLPIMIILCGLITTITARLISLLLNRFTSIAISAMVIFMLAMILNLISIFNFHLTLMPAVNFIIAGFTPFSMLISLIEASADDFFIIIPKGVISTFGTSTTLTLGYFATNFIFWIFAAMAIITGPLRIHSDLTHSTKLTMAQKNAGQKVTSQRHLNKHDFFIMMQQNSRLNIHIMLENYFLGFQTLLWGGALALFAWYTIYNIDNAIAIFLITIPLIIIYHSASICYSSQVINQKRNLVSLLLPIYANWLIRMLMIIGTLIAVFSTVSVLITASEQAEPINSKLVGYIITATSLYLSSIFLLICITFVCALFASGTSRTYGHAIGKLILAYFILAFANCGMLLIAKLFCYYQQLSIGLVNGQLILPLDLSSSSGFAVAIMGMTVLVTTLVVLTVYMVIFYRKNRSLCLAKNEESQ